MAKTPIIRQQNVQTSSGMQPVHQQTECAAIVDFPEALDGYVSAYVQPMIDAKIAIGKAVSFNQDGKHVTVQLLDGDGEATGKLIEDAVLVCEIE